MMLHRTRSLRTFFGTLFMVVLVVTAAAPAAAITAEEAARPTSPWTELRTLWGDVLEWAAVMLPASETRKGGEGGETGRIEEPAAGENNADDGPSIDPLG